jgi:hypothetical protein
LNEGERIREYLARSPLGLILVNNVDVTSTTARTPSAKNEHRGLTWTSQQRSALTGINGS